MYFACETDVNLWGQRSDCSGLNGYPLKDMSMSKYLKPVNMPVFGKSFFADITKLRLLS